MNDISTAMQQASSSQPARVYSYGELVDYLNALPSYEYSARAVERMAALNTVFKDIMHGLNTILVGGASGKSLAINFAAKLFAEESMLSCAVYSSHFLAYNERIVCNGEQINNKAFTDFMNQVVAGAELAGIQPTTHECIVLVGFLHALDQKAEALLLEVPLGGRFDISAVCAPKITAVTRVAEVSAGNIGESLDAIAEEMVSIAQPGALFVSAEQSKIRLQKMKIWTEARGGAWFMPVRKLANLPYIYEQLYGRTASLGERITQLYVEEILKRFSPFLRGNLLATQEGQRGRPTLEAKRAAEINPIKSMKLFWKEQFSFLRGRFEVLDKEKPLIVLDTASNVDGFTNVFLGVRLLHYQRGLKGFVLILGVPQGQNGTDLFKAVRYLLKKVTGEIIFVPLHKSLSGSCDAEELLTVCREMGIRARAASTVEQALYVAKELVDPREGLIAITGGSELVSEYWRSREVKRI